MEKFLVGHVQDEEKGTGVTVIIAPEGAIGGVSVRGAAPGTRETDLLRPMNTVERAHAVVLAGGSAFGLAASTGVMQYLHEQNIGFAAGKHIVPIVSSAVIFDLNYKTFAFPDEAMGYAAAKAATGQFDQSGSIGAGCGATAGKILGPDQAAKGGLGVASITLKNGAYITAIIVTNPLGDIYDGHGKMIAGVAHPQGLTTVDILLESAKFHQFAGENTTIGCLLTNAKLSKEQVNKLADLAHDGLALAIMPVHTAFDGDTLFALSSDEIETDFLTLGTACVEAVRTAVGASVQCNAQI